MGNESIVYVTIKVDNEKGIISVKQFGAEAEKSFALAARDSTAAARGIEQAAGGCAMLETAGRKLIPVLATAFSIQQIKAFGEECVSAASNLEETDNKFKVVFAGQETLATRWAGTLRVSYQMSEEGAKSYLATIANMLQAMGMTSDAAGRMGFEIVKLSAEMGSFNNIPVAQVMGDIQSALAGQFDTMKKYGIVLNETTVSQTALAMGLAKTTDQLTAGDKAQAAFTLMLRGADKAIGDIARSADSYANTSVRTTSATTDLSAAIGGKLLPALTSIKSLWTEIAQAMTGWIRNSTEDQIRALDQKIADYRKRIASTENEGGLFFVWVNKNEKQTLKELEYMRSVLVQQQELNDASAALLNRRVNPDLNPPPQLPSGPPRKGTTTAITEEYISPAGEYSILETRRRNEAAWTEQMATYDKQAKERRDRDNELNYELWQSAQATDARLITLSERTAEAMESNFSNLYFDIITRKFTTLRDYGTAVFESLARVASDVMGQISKEALFGSVKGPGLFGQWITSAHGNVFEYGKIATFGMGGVLTRPTIFPMANGYGLAGEAGIEVFMPAVRMPSGNVGVEGRVSSPSFNVNVFNNAAGAEARAEVSQTGNGGIQLDIIVDEIMAGKVVQGKTARALRTNYNLRPVVQRR